MSAYRVDYDEKGRASELLFTAEPWAAARVAGAQDVALVAGLLAKASMRRAAPPWAAPTALWAMLLCPGRRVVTRAGAGCPRDLALLPEKFSVGGVFLDSNDEVGA